jgi:hypothetical protein
LSCQRAASGIECVPSGRVMQTARVVMVVELRLQSGDVMRDSPDPAGGTFDSAGDFDRVLGGESQLPILGASDPHAETTLRSDEMTALLLDVETALSLANDGLSVAHLRLRVLANRCPRRLCARLSRGLINGGKGGRFLEKSGERPCGTSPLVRTALNSTVLAPLAGRVRSGCRRGRQAGPVGHPVL